MRNKQTASLPVNLQSEMLVTNRESQSQFLGLSQASAYRVTRCHFTTYYEATEYVQYMVVSDLYPL